MGTWRWNGDRHAAGVFARGVRGEDEIHGNSQFGQVTALSLLRRCEVWRHRRFAVATARKIAVGIATAEDVIRFLGNHQLIFVAGDQELRKAKACSSTGSRLSEMRPVNLGINSVLTSCGQMQLSQASLSLRETTKRAQESFDQLESQDLRCVAASNFQNQHPRIHFQNRR